jgi:hypothetical protein
MRRDVIGAMEGQSRPATKHRICRVYVFWHAVLRLAQGHVLITSMKNTIPNALHAFFPVLAAL